LYIKKLRIFNYKVYPDENVIDFDEPNPGSRLNCYLFGGLNGAGKTSLLQAIVLGLYGQAAENIIFERKPSQNLPKVYARFLEESFSHGAKDAGDDQMQIEVTLQDGAKSITIERTWWFTESGAIDDEGIEVWENGKPLKVAVDEDQRFEVLLEYVDSLIPRRVAKFFFFDGEEIKSISERDPAESVIEGLDALLGFSTLGRLEDDLEKVLKEIQGEVDDSPTKASYLRAMAECDELKERQQRLEEELQDVERKRTEVAHEAARIDDRLKTFFQGSSVQESSEIIDRITELDGQSRALTNEIGRFVGDLLYLALPSSLLGEAGEQLAGELRGRAWEADRTKFDPQRDRVVDRLFGKSAPQPDPALTKGQTDFLRRRLKEEWTEMFNPPPNGVPESLIFDNWTVAAAEDAVRHLDEVQQRTRQELVTRISTRNRIDREIQKLQAANKQFQDGPEAQDAIERKAQLAGDLTELEIRERDLQREIEALASEIKNANAQASKLGESVSQTEQVRRRYETCRALRATVREFMDELRQRRVNELSRKMTDMMTKLAHKDDLVSKIAIDPDTYVLRILNSKGEEVQAPSAGEREVFALSMLWGLARISKRNLPVVIDTPLGRLDQAHRGSIVKHYFPQAGEQVIILSTDAEIDQGWYKALKPSIVQEFALEHDDAEEVTTIIADRYFEFS
jgi:DNA sulfur modification protein DndD